MKATAAKKRWRVWVLVAAALLPVVTAFAFAFLRSHFSLWRGWGAATVPARLGVDGPSGNREAVYWRVSRSFGAVSCESAPTPFEIVASPPASPIAGGSGGARPPSWTFPVERGGSPLSASPGEAVTDVGTGWPFPCLAVRMRLTARVTTSADAPMLDAMGLKVGDTVHELIPVYGHFVEQGEDGWRSVLRPDSGVWPTRVLWGGLAVSVVVHALILYTPFVVARAWAGARARRRRLQGRCCKCGFDLSGVATPRICPECGKPA